MTSQEQNAASTLFADNTITATGDAIYTAGNTITLGEGFEVLAGGALHAYIAQCTTPPTPSSRSEAISVGEDSVVSLSIYPNPIATTAQLDFYLPNTTDV